MVTLNQDSVRFEFFRPDATQVNLAGDFNDWQSDLPMVRDEGGYWKASVALPAGEFKFRYCADGQWFTDYAAFGVEPGRFGMDSIVRVPQPTLKVAAGGPVSKQTATQTTVQTAAQTAAQTTVQTAAQTTAQTAAQAAA